MDNPWLGGPVRTLAVIVLSTLLAENASAEAVTRGVGAEMALLSPVVLSVQPEQPGHAGEYGLSLETAVRGSEANAHLQITGGRPSEFALAFDIQVGLPPIHQESNMPRALFDDGDSAAGMLLRVDSRAHGVTGSLSIEIRNLDDGSQMHFDLDYEGPTFELFLDEGMYSILVRGTNETSEPVEDRDIRGVPSPGTLLLAGPIAAWLRRRRK